MIQLIIGEKGKGKTKVLLEKANTEIKTANGNYVYLDKSAQHMYELNNKIRLIDVTGFPVGNCDEFLGFVCGIISQDHDLEQMYLDSFLKLACLEGEDIKMTLDTLRTIGEKYHITFVLSISRDAHELPENAKAEVVVSL